MRIGIDIDETVFYIAQRVLDNFNHVFDTNYKLEEVKKRSIRKSFGFDKEVSDRIVGSMVKRQDLKLIEGAYDTIRKIAVNNDIYFITKRRSLIDQETISLLDSKLRIPYMLYMKEDGDKHDIINEENIQIMIEDDADVAEEIEEKGNCTILLLDKPWNRMVKESFRMVRVYSWSDIDKYFMTGGYYG